MKLTFYSNFINHHQVPVADVLYRLLGDDYKFVATMPVPDHFLKAGYPNYDDKPYLLKAYEDKTLYEEALRLSDISDIVVVGSASDAFFVNRIKKNKITFLYNERWFKKIKLSFLSPKTWWYWYSTYIKYRDNRYYMLCASAFLPNDTSIIGAFPNKCFKWGYFTEVNEFNIDEYILKKNKSEKVRLLWCARFIKFKRPDMVVKLAGYLRDKGFDFHIDMFGTGELVSSIEELINRNCLRDYVTLCGNKANYEILEEMRIHDLFLFTSNKEEGWGAVLNEAMASGCAVVASNMIGAAPLLIEPGVNGVLFKSENQDSLNFEVEKLLLDRELISSLGIAAYRTMLNKWSPYIAAKNLLILAESIIDGRTEDILKEGPCSKAFFYKK